MIEKQDVTVKYWLAAVVSAMEAEAMFASLTWTQGDLVGRLSSPFTFCLNMPTVPTAASPSDAPLCESVWDTNDHIRLSFPPNPKAESSNVWFRPICSLIFVLSKLFLV